MTPISSASDQPNPPKRERVLTATLNCYLCGHTCGTLESPSTAGLPPIAHFTPADDSGTRQVMWQRLRCPRCGGGSLLLEGLEVVTRRQEPRFDLLEETPRRGRPPRWLVERRAKQDAA
ncbi:MAG: hypothetical protein JO057_12690 [Chloroflexi bacterium]|nr:hypothetical protein [Chloroflexota bacterium]